MNPNTTLGPVRISLNSALATIEPSCEEILKPLLCYPDIEFVAAGTKVTSRKCIRPIYTRQSNNQLLIPAGIVPRVQQDLRQRGIEVNVHDHLHLDRPELQVWDAYVAEAERSFPGLTEAIRGHGLGVFKAGRGAARIHFAGMLCKLMRNARIFIASATKERAREMAIGLGHHLGGDVEAVHLADWRSPCRVVCGTFTSFDRCAASDWNVLLFEDAREALGKVNHDNRGAFRQHRVYAFIDPNAALSAKEQIQAEVLAGPTIYACPTKTVRPQPVVDVVFANSPLCRVRRPHGPREQKQQAWTDYRRNRAIASVARAFASRDPAPLWQHGLFLDTNDPFSRWLSPPHVVVLVESVQHAEQIAKLLPDWTVEHSLARNGNSVLQHRFANWGCVPSRSIVTAVRAAEYRRLYSDVLIMATGGAWPQLPRGLAPLGDRLLIVDFADDGDPALARETRQRRAAYADLDYSIVRCSADLKTDFDLQIKNPASPSDP